jgi:hypothetical protein
MKHSKRFLCLPILMFVSSVTAAHAADRVHAGQWETTIESGARTRVMKSCVSNRRGRRREWGREDLSGDPGEGRGWNRLHRRRSQDIGKSSGRALDLLREDDEQHDHLPRAIRTSR